MKPTTMWRLALLVLFAATPILCGCGSEYPPRYPISGVVKFRDGSPVKTGTIEACVPGSPWTATGTIARDGTFSLTTVKPNDGAIAGEHQVIVRQLIVTYLPVKGHHDHGKLVDPKFADYKTSKLTLTVDKAGNNKVELIVDEKPSK
jgi:hypothetical protein